MTSSVVLSSLLSHVSVSPVSPVPPPPSLPVPQATENGAMNGTGPAAGTEERDIFPRSLLRDLAWAEYAGKFSPAITADQPGDGLLVRPLQRADYDKG